MGRGPLFSHHLSLLPYLVGIGCLSRCAWPLPVILPILLQARARAKAETAEKKAAMMRTVNAAMQERADSLDYKYRYARCLQCLRARLDW